ncbi:HprK-related kinase B [Neiella marina]|uniref:HprK-related kinase B n=1 Tax=Neiella holothuriorum TaxID=2870530 RepID=A0ABS7ED27_9GAMM|nr:HprK-related kinase B [Neiella holothuriorum]MBW8190242.1 HprK-related kinase B [Neiella holothuriorum]
MSFPATAQDAATTFIEQHTMADQRLLLTLPGMTIDVVSNQLKLLEELADYFRHVATLKPAKQALSTDGSSDTAATIVCIEHANVELDVAWQQWQREAGKTGRKDAFYPLEDGRLLFKVRTGMVFLQSLTYRIAIGPCLANSNQIINFINNQYINKLQQSDWLIGHAAAVTSGSKGMAFCGFSGGGKSTSMLHLMANGRYQFVSNDRLFIRREHGQLQCRGIPKLPRINPGTIINNPALLPIINEQQAVRYKAMHTNELWPLEEKFDADVIRLFGANRINHASSLDFLVILNWQPSNASPCTITQVDIAKRHDLLPALMKSPGPFYQDQTGKFLANGADVLTDKALQQVYIDALQGCEVYEVSGGVNFEQLLEHCQRLLD